MGLIVRLSALAGWHLVNWASICHRDISHHLGHRQSKCILRPVCSVPKSQLISDRRTWEKVTKHLSETEEGVTNTNECNFRVSVGFTFNSRRTSLSRTSPLCWTRKLDRQTEREKERQEQRARPPWNLHTQHPSPSLPLCVHKSGHNG